MHFYKYHGLGNDFILTLDLYDDLEATPERAARLCNRHTGVGADGWMLVRGSETCDLQMFLYNADGSVAEMCGNGLRCFAKCCYDHGLVRKKTFTVETLAGPMAVRITERDGVCQLVTANLGKPSFEKEQIPMAGTGPCQRETIRVLDRDLVCSACLMGVPHTVVFGRNFTDEDVLVYGPKIEKDPRFPRGTNVNFCNLLDDHTVELRTWERGCGRTLACGTGSCAAAALCVREGYTRNELEVRLQEGSLFIEVTDRGILMTGPAELAFEGETKL